MDGRITYIGLDDHKETIAVALAEGSGRGEVGAHGQISNMHAALSNLAKLHRADALTGSVGGLSIQKMLNDFANCLRFDAIVHNNLFGCKLPIHCFDTAVICRCPREGGRIAVHFSS